MTIGAKGFVALFQYNISRYYIYIYPVLLQSMTIGISPGNTPYETSVRGRIEKEPVQIILIEFFRRTTSVRIDFYMHRYEQIHIILQYRQRSRGLIR
jgi:hypothetical protein